MNRLFAHSTAVFLLSVLGPASAEVVLDGSMGRAGAVAQNGNDYAVTHDLGQIRGANLFHSFSQFNIRSGESATFSGPGGLANVLSRVTGGNASNIDGLLRSTVPGANFWFVNPSGVFFGPGASIDVPGSFYAGTANYIGFADGSRFDATNPATTTLTAAAPTAFGFLGAEPAPLQVTGSDLSVSEGSELLLVGGDLRVGGGAALHASEGAIRLEGVGSAGEVSLRSPVIEVGDVSGGSTIAVSDSEIAGQTLIIRGGSIETAGETNLEVSTSSPDHGSRVEVLAQVDVDLGGSTWVRANGASGGEARIESKTGTTSLYGSVEARGETGLGGHVELLGVNVGLFGDAFVDVSGEQGGGIALVGGDYQGLGSVRTAVRTYVGADALIRADARSQGDGGRVIVWGDERAGFDGRISARGGNVWGDGGFVEVSSRGLLGFQGGVDLSAVNGAVGELLLDPQSITISNATDDDVTPQSPFEPIPPGPSTLNVSTLVNALATADVTVATSDSGPDPSDPGDINLTAPIDYDGIGSEGRTLTLEAHNDLNIWSWITDQDLSTDSDFINLVLMADSDSSGSGRLNIPYSVIDTRGGDLALSGASVSMGGTIQMGGGELDVTGNTVGIVGSRALIQSVVEGDEQAKSLVFHDIERLAIGVRSEFFDGTAEANRDVNIHTSTSGAGNGGDIVFRDVAKLQLGDFEVGIVELNPFETIGSTDIPVGIAGTVETITAGAGNAGNVTFTRIGEMSLNSGVSLACCVFPAEVNFEQSFVRSSSDGTGVSGQIRFGEPGAGIELLNIAGARIESGKAVADSFGLTFSDVGELTLGVTSGSGEVFGGSGSGEVEATADVNFVGVISSPSGVSFSGIDSLVVEGGLISSDTTTAVDAGNLEFVDIGRLVVDGVVRSNTSNPDSFQLPSDDTGSGNAGDIGFTNIGELIVAGNGQISSRTKGGRGSAGTISMKDVGVLTVARSLSVDPETGDETIHVGRISTSSTSLAQEAEAGTIEMNGVGVLMVDGGEINSRTLGKGEAGNVELTDINVLLVKGDGQIRSNTTATGPAGAVEIATTGMGLETFDATSSRARDAFGAAYSALDQDLDSVTVQDSARIASESSLSEDTPSEAGFTEFRDDPSSLGNAGEIDIVTSTLRVVSDDSEVNGRPAISTNTAGAGLAGTLDVEALAVEVIGGDIASATTGMGDAGFVTVVATDQVLVGQGGRISSASISNVDGESRGELGVAGGVLVAGDSVLVQDGGRIIASTASDTPAFDGNDDEIRGSVTVLAGGDVRVSGTGDVDLENPVGIVATTTGLAAAGDVRVFADGNVLVTDGGSINTTTLGEGDAGFVLIRSPDTNNETLPVDDNTGMVLVASGASIESATLAEGKAGDVTIEARMVVVDGTESEQCCTAITVASQPGTDVGGVLGDAGSIIIVATGSVSVFGNPQSGDETARIAAIASTRGTSEEDAPESVFTTESGSAGSVSITAPHVSIADNGSVVSSSEGSGNAGDVVISADVVELVGEAVTDDQQILTSEVSTSSALTGGGGLIDIRATQLIHQSGGKISSTVNDHDNENNELRGLIGLFAPSITLDGATIEATTTGTRDAGSITLGADRFDANGQTRISSSSADIASGRAGNVGIAGVSGEEDTRATTVTLNDSEILTKAEGVGGGGSLFIRASESIEQSGGLISSTVKDFDPPIDDQSPLWSGDSDPSNTQPGRIDLSAPEIRLIGATIEANTEGTRRAGIVSLGANALHVSEESNITSTSSAVAKGGAGDITIVGASGDVDSQARVVTLNESQLLTRANGEGAGGFIEIDASESISQRGGTISSAVRDRGVQPNILGEVSLRAPTINIVGGQVEATTTGNREAGSVALAADHLHLSGKSMVTSSSVGTASGPAGAVFIEGRDGENSRAESVSLGDGEILTVAEAVGAGGRIQIGVSSFTAAPGGRVSSTVNNVPLGSGPDDGLGNITFRTDTMRLDGARIEAQTQGSRDGGGIFIAATDIDLRQGAEITAGSTGTGRAGDVFIVASESFDSRNSKVTTESTRADGGDIDFQVKTLFQLEDASVTTSVGGGEGSGGNITIDPKFVVLRSGRIEANAFEGSGGKIKIVADNFFATPDSVVQASSQLGIDGDIEIDAAGADVVGGLAQLPANFQDPGRLLLTPCGQRVGTAGSRIEVSPLAGLPRSPEEYFFSATGPTQYPFGEDSPTGEEAAAVGVSGNVYLLAMSPCAQRHRIH